jgi:hypothetical protein
MRYTVGFLIVSVSVCIEESEKYCCVFYLYFLMLLCENIGFLMRSPELHDIVVCDEEMLIMSSWLQIQQSRVRFPKLLDFLRSTGSGTSWH